MALYKLIKAHVFAAERIHGDDTTADSDEAGHAFQVEAGHPFRFEAGHRSDLKSATWRHSGGSRRCCSYFSIRVKRAKHGAERAGFTGTARGRPGSQQEGPARDAACPCS